MWILDDVAGSGSGRALLEGVERLLGAVEITLHARLTVRSFYEKCGYTAEGGVFEEIGIPHIRMTRRMKPH
jgi:predicted GNAT family N-acyltransferase